MMRPYQMNSVIITGPNTMLETVIKELHNLKILHIVEHSKNELADIGGPLESANKLSEILVKIRALMAALNIKKEETKFELKRSLTDIESTTKKLNLDVSVNLDELRRIEDTISKNEAAKQELEILKNINVPLEAFTFYKSLAYFTGYIKNNAKTLREKLSKITNNFMLFDSVVKKRNFIVLFIDAKNKEQAMELLQKNNFAPVNFTNIADLRGNAANNLKRMEEEAIKLQKKKEYVKRNLDKLSQEYKVFLLTADEFLAEQLEKAEAPLKFASTQSSFLIKGWIPTEELKVSIERLNKVAKNRIFIHFEPAKKEDKVPVKLKNPKFAKAFEFFIDLYSIPIYKEIDPTFFIFLTFPIFFGIMLGDIGYGAISSILFWILKKKMPKAKNFCNILLLSSVATILFGFFFGEFFGYEFIHPIISREHDMFTLMYLAIAIGIVHVNAGLVIGFINEMKIHGIIHAIYGKLSWIILQIGVALLVLSYFSRILISPLVGAGFLGLSILMLLKEEGIKGLFELPTIFANIMSYVRLMAIGTSSVILALVINDLAKGFFTKGGFFILFGVSISLIGHVINIALGLLASFLHSLRLHYVEFFSKFFHGGAKKYQPFGAKE